MFEWHGVPLFNIVLKNFEFLVLILDYIWKYNVKLLKYTTLKLHKKGK